MKTAGRAGFYRDNTEKTIKSLSLQLSKLQPMNGQNKGPAFISLASQFNAPAEYEGMLGSIAMDGFLGEAFSGAANDNSALSALSMLDTPMAELLMEYAEEAGSDSHNNYGRGRGSIALYERLKSKNPHIAFNAACELDETPEDFDLRMDIEERLSALQSEYDQWVYQERLEQPYSLAL